MDRARTVRLVAASLFLLAVGHGVAVAQAPAGSPAVPEANAGLTRQVILTPAEQATQAETFLARMDSSRTLIAQMLAKARQDRDVIKVLCLNDKLNQTDVAIRSARERQTSLQAAASKSDADLAAHDFTILTVLSQRSDQLSSEANQCIGKENDVLGEFGITVTFDPELTPVDPSEYPGFNVVVEPPACGSCVN